MTWLNFWNLKVFGKVWSINNLWVETKVSIDLINLNNTIAVQDEVDPAVRRAGSCLDKSCKSQVHIGLHRRPLVNLLASTIAFHSVQRRYSEWRSGVQFRAKYNLNRINNCQFKFVFAKTVHATIPWVIIMAYIMDIKYWFLEFAITMLSYNKISVCI